MMKILIVCSKEGRLTPYAEALRKGAESKGHLVTVREADERGELVTAHGFDLVLVGSPILGVFGGKVANDIKSYLSSMKRLEGKDAIAFTTFKLIGTDKGLRKLMEVMEAQGCMVQDFRAFRSAEEARQFAAGLSK